MISSRLLAMGAALSTLMATPALAGPPTPSLLPPSSNPGECYARVKIPATYSTDRQPFVTEDGHRVLQVTQPRLQARQENIMVKEASTRFRVRQPSYRSVTERIMTRPAYDKLSVTPPQFSTVRENVQTSAPHLVWKKGNPAQLRSQGYVIHSTADGRPRGYYGSGHSSDQSAFYGAGLGGQPCGDNCEIWCLVEEPGQSRSITRRVMSHPGDVRRTPVPAQYQTITKQIVSDPGGVEQIHVPAEYRSVRVEDIVEPGRVSETMVPPSYGTFETKQIISPERYEWRRVLCAPGTGSIKSSADYGHSSSSYSSYSAPLHHGSSSPSTQPAYWSGAQHNSQSGYYGAEQYPAYSKTRQHMTIKGKRRPHRMRR